MDIPGFYKKRHKELSGQVSNNKNYAQKLALFRLFLFIGIFIAIYFTIPIHFILAIISGVVIFGLFIYLVVKDITLKRKREFLQQLKKINTHELRFLNNDFAFAEDGNEFANKEHPYTSDLDIFGPASIFQALNRTTGQTGKKILAEYLVAFSGKEEIIAKQQAVKELKKEVDWRQNIQASGTITNNQDFDSGELLQWLKSENSFYGKSWVPFVINILPAVTLILIPLTIFLIPSGYLVLILLFNFWIGYLSLRKINKIHNQVTRQEEYLKSYSNILHQIEEKQFDSAFLQAVQEKTKTDKKPASFCIRQLSKTLNKLDYRLNLLFAIPLNMILLWDIRQAYILEKWKTGFSKQVEKWFDAIAEFEAISSLANFAFNKPEWIYPAIEDKHLTFEAKNIGHPLIPEDNRVDNDFGLTGQGKIALITGSNMSGKTTFLRTLGVNMVLGMAGCPVCAESLHFSPVKLMTSMRIADSLTENTSSFYAELKRLKMILDAVKRKEKVFLLLDEILKGTNSNDRHTGSKALIRQLVKYKAAGLLATHDLDLSNLEKEMPLHIENYNFDVQIEGEELFFDYKLHKGVCTSLNASVLMKKMGIEILYSW